MKKFFTLAVCLVSLASGSQTLAAKIYTWVDSDGVTHFSEHPPKNTQTTVIKPRIGHSEPVDYGSSDPVQNPEDAKAKAEQQAAAEVAQALKDPLRCASARKNLQTLENFGRVKVKGDDGELRYLTPSEQQERLKSTQQAINESC